MSQGLEQRQQSLVGKDPSEPVKVAVVQAEPSW